MQQQKPVCVENEGLANFMFQKWQELAATPKGISDNVNKVLCKAFLSVCNSKIPIKTLKDFCQTKGVGRWTLKLMQDYFKSNSHASDPGTLPEEECTMDGNNGRSKRYVPQRNSAAYALLITLHRERMNGSDFMRKQELINAAEASGLSRVPIVPEKSTGRFGNSSNDWYTGWRCMKTLITRGLVVKSSNPAKYMITEEGKDVACECLLRSGLSDVRNKGVQGISSDASINVMSETYAGTVITEPAFPTDCCMRQDGVPLESLPQVEVGNGFHHESYRTKKTDHISTSFNLIPVNDGAGIIHNQTNPRCSYNVPNKMKPSYAGDNTEFPLLRPCSLEDPPRKTVSDSFEASINVLAMPPLDFGGIFRDTYQVILILDNREQFLAKGSKCGKLVEYVQSQFNIMIEVRRLPVGDGIWIARRKDDGVEYVLDFIVERKKVDDLRSSIRDNRYKDQKLRLLRCGIRKLIYLVEGDPNACEGSEGVKTACFTSEILEGFDIQRTKSISDTLRKYGHLTHAITDYYSSGIVNKMWGRSGVCPLYAEFIKRCQNLDKVTVSDVFAIQLMQVAHVTEDVAVAVLDLYPTLSSLAHAYSLLDGGDVRDQEDMLMKQSNCVVSGIASRNIFRCVWGD